jgi:uncharacterized YigZ family protein
VSTQEEARAVLKEWKEAHSDASHVVHAFVLGEGNTRTAGCSDDGEPPGTAGRPVLDVLGGSGGGNVILGVARWFGGTKLGTGGLVKAYSETARAVLVATTWHIRRELVRVGLTLGYEQLRPLQTLLETLHAEQIRESFAESVTVVASVPREQLEELQLRTKDLTRGQLQWGVDPQE